MQVVAGRFLSLALMVGLGPAFWLTSISSAGLSAVQGTQADSASSALKEGRRLLRQGKADLALVKLQASLNLYTSAGNRKGIAAANNELGELYSRQGQPKIALDYYQKAYDALTGVLKEEQKGAAAGTQAARLAGSTAGTATEAAASLSDTDFNANLLLAKLGDTNFRLGDMSAAAAKYSQMRVKKPEGAAKKTGGMFGRLASGIAIGSATDSVAIGSAAEAVGVALQAKNQLDQYRVMIAYMTYHLGLGRIAFANKDLSGAQRHFQEAAEAGKGGLSFVSDLGQTRRFRAAALTSLGDVTLAQAKPKDAFKQFEQAEKTARKDKRPDLIWPALRGMGRSLWLQTDQQKDVKKSAAMRETALGHYREALQTIEALRAGSLRADESRTTFLSTTKDVFDEAASALAEMALLNHGSAGPETPLTAKALEYAAEAFRVTEQSRARSLLDLLAETNASITEGVPAELLKRKQTNLDRQQEIAELLTGINLTPDDQKSKPSDLENELEKLQVEFDQIENQIRVASPRYAALTSGQPLTLAEVQQKVLDDSTALLEYNLGPDASYLWVLTSQEVRLFKLPGKAAVDKLATDLRAQLIPSRLQRRIVGIDVMADASRGLGIVSGAEDAAPFVAAANAAYKVLVEPAAAVIGQKRLLVVADGALNYIPFEALVTSAGPADYASVPYLLKTNEIVYAPSASVIGAIRQQGRRATGGTILVIADPVFNSVDPRAKGATVSAGANAGVTRGLGIESALTDVAGQSGATSAESAKMQGLPLARLSGTRTEAEQIATLAKAAGLQTDAWLDLNANEENVETRDVAKYRVVHVATHGLLNAERPQFTGLVLSLIGNKTEDGFLRTDEVFNLKLGSPLVMLSACETGLGKEKRGEGVMGLTRAFMYAGAPTVGVSLWSVADKSTAELMTDFYKRMLTPTGNTSPATAMRNAQLAMIAGKKYSAPFYWSPFILIGDWR